MGRREVIRGRNGQAGRARSGHRYVDVVRAFAKTLHFFYEHVIRPPIKMRLGRPPLTTSASCIQLFTLISSLNAVTSTTH